MAVKLRTRPPVTPRVVVEYGWRDERYEGVDQCSACHGWGTVSALIGQGKDRRNVHRTCESCGGRGHR